MAVRARHHPALSDAYRHFSPSDAPLATEAALYLAASAQMGQKVPAGVAEALGTAKETFTATGLRLLAGRAFDTLFSKADLPLVQLQVLGEVRTLRHGNVTKLRQRSLELLVLLSHRPEGYRAEELSEALYGDEQVAALRVEIHRLRKTLGLTVQTQPYRLETPVQADSVALETALNSGCLRDAVVLYRGSLLPASTAPGIAELRNALEVTLKATVLAADDTEALWACAQQMPFDLELWEALELRLPPGDPRTSVVAGRSARVRTELGV